VFLGPQRMHAHGRIGLRMMVPLWILSGLAILGGFVQVPTLLGGHALIRTLLVPVFGPIGDAQQSAALEVALLLVASCVPLAGIWLAWSRYRQGRYAAPPVDARSRFLRSGLRFDTFYDVVIVRPVLFVVRRNSNDFIDSVFTGIASLAQACNAGLRRTQTGRVRWYAGWLTAGSALALAIAVLS
jgi:NADH-quinone oxidoreductase subunit L